MRLVDIVGIGVQKAGTTWLFRCLQEHPEITTARAPSGSKELDFFNHRFENGIPWYHSQFPAEPGILAEFSPLYFHSRDVPGRLARYNPDARLILSLRNPVERAVSQHVHDVRRGVMPADLSFSEAIHLNPSYVGQGMYADHLERYLACFPPEQLHVVVYEKIRVEPLVVAQEMFGFLGLDDSFVPASLHERINKASRPRSALIARSVTRAGRWLESKAGPNAIARVRATGAPALVRKLNERPAESVVVDDATKAHLLELFAPTIDRLEAILGRSFDQWRRPVGV